MGWGGEDGDPGVGTLGLGREWDVGSGLWGGDTGMGGVGTGIGGLWGAPGWG